MALNYTSPEGFTKWVSVNFAGILANDAVNSFDAETQAAKDTITTALEFAEGEIDGYLRKRGYKTPISDTYTRTHSVIKVYAFNIAAYELYGRKGITKERYYKYTRLLQNLQDISTGEKHLPESVPMILDGKISSGNSLTSFFAQSSLESKLSL